MTPVTRLRDRIDWVPGAHRPRPRRVGAAALVVIALLLAVAFGGWRPWAGSGQLVRAQFANADQVTPGRTLVRVAGVKVGFVDSIERAERGAVVVMDLRDGDVDLRHDAGAHLRLRTVLGGTRYIELEPGSPSAAPLGDAVIPARRTSTQVDWDDLNQVFEGDVRAAQRAMLSGLRDSLADPAAAARTIDTAGPALRVAGRGVRPLQGTRTGDLRRLVAATGRVADALSRDRALDGLVAGGARTFGVTATHRRALGEAVALSPAALDATRTTMLRLDRTLAHLDPLVRDLRPGARLLGPAARALRPALGETDRLLQRARPLLRDLRPALRNLAAASREGVPLLDAFDPTLRRARNDLMPWLRERDKDTGLRNYESIGPLASVLDSAGSSYDAQGGKFNFPFTFTGDSVLVPCGGLSVNPGELNRCDAVNAVLGKALGRRKRR